MTESIADGLSVVGLVVGFPLLLLGFMIALERLESWGLREAEPTPVEAPPREAPRADGASAAAPQQLGAEAPRQPDSSTVGGRPTG